MSSPGFLLNLTGRMSIVIELQDYGPIQIRVDDEEAIRQVLRVLLEGDKGEMSVDSYDKRTEKRLRQVLEGPVT